MARLHSASTTEAAELYPKPPSSSTGTRLSGPELSIAIGLRLGLPVAKPAICICGTLMDTLGDHALSCNNGVERSLGARIRSSNRELGTRQRIVRQIAAAIQAGNARTIIEAHSRATHF